MLGGIFPIATFTDRLSGVVTRVHRFDFRAFRTSLVRGTISIMNPRTTGVANHLVDFAIPVNAFGLSTDLTNSIQGNTSFLKLNVEKTGADNTIYICSNDSLRKYEWRGASSVQLLAPRRVTDRFTRTGRTRWLATAR